VLLLLPCGYMLNESKLETAGSAWDMSLQYWVVSFLIWLIILLIEGQIGLVVLAYFQMELLPSTFLFFRCTKGTDRKTSQGEVCKWREIVGAHRGRKGLLSRANFKRKLLLLNICNDNCTFGSHLQRQMIDFITVQWSLALVTL
jgi:hypothetical protein